MKSIIDINQDEHEDTATARRVLVVNSFGKNNLPAVLTYTDGSLTKISKTDGATTWEKTFTYTGSDLTGISAWVEV